MKAVAFHWNEPERGRKVWRGFRDGFKKINHWWALSIGFLNRNLFLQRMWLLLYFSPSESASQNRRTECMKANSSCFLCLDQLSSNPACVAWGVLYSSDFRRWRIPTVRHSVGHGVCAQWKPGAPCQEGHKKRNTTVSPPHTHWNIDIKRRWHNSPRGICSVAQHFYAADCSYVCWAVLHTRGPRPSLCLSLSLTQVRTWVISKESLIHPHQQKSETGCSQTT